MDSRLAAELIDAQFPALRPARAGFLGEGCDNRAFVVNGAWVFRFPKRPDVERQLAIEARLLAALDQSAALPLSVPRVSFHGRPSAAYPLRFGGYRLLPGVTANLADPDELPLPRLAPVLGRFLSVLHAFPVDEAARCGVPEAPMEGFVGEVGEEALENFGLVAELAPEAADRWRAFLTAGPAGVPAGRRVLVHNDLAAEHVLYDAAAETLSGVIDWADAAIGDPSADLSGVLHWGGMPLLERVLQSYGGPVDEDTISCGRYLAACRGAGDVAFGVERGRGEYVAAGLRALRLCIDG
ncbi:MAG TPA: phosphotransferase [Longimicrobium sp.]|nr:phosphotransferase [Longimicrobium sp.]